MEMEKKVWSKLRTALLCILVAAMPFSMAGCGGDSSDDSTTGTSANTIVYGSADYTRINPALDEHGEINILIFNGLTAHGEDNIIEPCLAKSWEYDSATNTYTFALEEGVKWHDGEAFTADDVKFTYEAIMDPANESENAPNYEDVEEIKVIDDYTVSFRLSAPNAAFLDYMTMAILPEHLLADADMQTDDYFFAPVGTGPYKFESWDAGQSIVLTANEDYFKGAPNIETVIFKIVEDDNAKALQLQSGELNISQIAPKEAEMFEDTDGYTVYDMTTSDYRGILYNFNNEYWQENADLIPAISYAIDKQAILDSVVLGKGDVAYGPIQRNMYNNEDVEHYDYDPDKAVQILEEAGCTKEDDGYWYRNGEKIGFTINATPGDEVRKDMAQICAQQLQEIGLDVKADVPENGIDWGGQECCIIGWGSPFDADDHTYKVFGTDKGANYSGYSNADVDKYLTEAREVDTSDDPSAYNEERAEAYDAFQVALAENPAYTFTCYIDAIYVADSSIKGIDEDALLGHHGVGIFYNISDWTIEE